MKNLFNRNTFFLLIAALVIANLALMFCGCETKKAAGQLPYRIVKGPISFAYTVRRESSSNESTVRIRAQEIQIFENYVIIIENTGLTQLIPVSNVLRMHWVKDNTGSES